MRSEFRRDGGLRLIARGTAWFAAGALVAAGVASAALAKELPGRSSSGASGGATPPQQPLGGGVSSQATVPPQSLEPQTGSPETLTPPAQVPQPTYIPPVVSSGGS